MENISDLIVRLREQIRFHEHLYFVEGNPQISDREFDKLMQDLQKLETQNPELISPDSPTQRVGETVTSFNPVKHRVPMMSIENSYSAADIMDWLARSEKLAGRSIFPVVAELKIDGVSGSFTYRDGQMVAGATRGNGVEGDLVSENVKTIRSLPLSIKSRFDMDLRGEIYIKRSTLSELNKKRAEAGEELFKNCRNLTTGTIKSLNPAVAAQRQLQAMIYGIAQAKDLGFKTHSDTLRFLADQGFKLNYRWGVCNSAEEIMEFIEKIAHERHEFDFDIDGIVLKIDNLALQEELKSTSKAPRWAIAYKYPQERAVAKLLQVEWQIGRSQLTPVAHLEPVQLGGTTVSRASLHNLDQIKEKDIRVGDYVVIEKAGYIIPYIVESLPDRRDGREIEILPPQNCPTCGNALTITLEEDGEGSTLVRCNNIACRGVIARRITHFVTQLEIENFGPQLIDRLLETGVIKEVEDILALEEAALAKLDRMGEKSASKIISGIKKAAGQPLGKLISGLGIANVGAVIGESIADALEHNILRFLGATSAQLTEIKGIQAKVAQSITSFITDPANQNLLRKLQSWWHGPSEEELASRRVGDQLAGKTLVVTGEASVPRRQIEDLIKKHGGTSKSSVSAKTDFLLIGSLEDDGFVSNKKSKAQQLNVPIINEIKLCEILGIDFEEFKKSG